MTVPFGADQFFLRCVVRTIRQRKRRDAQGYADNESGQQEYSHHFQTGVGIDARKPALWGGEVNNQGESDVRRSSFVDSAFESIGKQVTEAAQQLTQRTYESAAAIEHTERVLKQEEIVLKSVRIAYADGSEPPRIVDLARLELLLDEKLQRMGRLHSCRPMWDDSLAWLVYA